MTFIILACALPKVWWPFFVVLFYAVSVLPMTIARRRSQDLSGTSPCSEFALFLTAGIVLSTFAYPIVLAKSQVIRWMACNLTLAGNVIMYLTIIMFALRENNAEGAYGGMF
ncbi:unnamed protein product [Hermetia illucens]|uniref:Leptin receptor gene-related protein n=1 Tax=Hermetia illucens TaxID=343691 RepID=A0A7R8UB46_HERIL|nr:vacuolar protein sorting-associated protein 55 homolog [Hermetia illucens]XP_037920997.1 vacuolar protein sorting-associated protein 55 homolog [Hermetia illucens]CAD7076669.1 unnamed protein product [Hermetia illucens]